LRASEFLRTLELVENRSQQQILEDIGTVSADIIRIRTVAHDSQSGSISTIQTRRVRSWDLDQDSEWIRGKGCAEGDDVHQELRVLRRMLNVAVRKKLLFANPCSGVEFPARIDTLFRPHYMGWSEQHKIEIAAPEYLRNVIQIVTETGPRICKELIPMKKEQLDLENRTVWILNSKTPDGVADVPLSDVAITAFQSQLAISGPSPYLFPNEDLSGHQKGCVGETEPPGK
jgi:integrase